MKTNGRMKRIPARLLLLLAGWWLAGTSLAQTTVEYIHTDALGSVVAVTNAAGQVIERNDYEPYGAIIGKPSYGGVGFTGHVQDAATGLTYMQQRYYDPMCGCFLSVDPVTADANTGANFNRYAYANSNPYRFTDPDGRQVRDTLESIMRQQSTGCQSNPHCQFAFDNKSDATKSGNDKEERGSIAEPPIPLARSMGELIENTTERIWRRTSFSASGGIAAGLGADMVATKTTQPWQRDKVGVYKVFGLGGYAGATANYRLFSWGEKISPVTGLRLKGNPFGYYKLRLGAGLSAGISVTTHTHGGHVQIQLGGGTGVQAIIKPPAMPGWEKEL